MGPKPDVAMDCSWPNTALSAVRLNFGAGYQRHQHARFEHSATPPVMINGVTAMATAVPGFF